MNSHVAPMGSKPRHSYRDFGQSSSSAPMKIRVVTAVVGLVLTFMGNRYTTVRRGDALDGGRYEYEEEHRSI